MGQRYEKMDEIFMTHCIRCKRYGFKQSEISEVKFIIHSVRLSVGRLVTGRSIGLLVGQTWCYLFVQVSFGHLAKTAAQIIKKVGR